MDFKKSQVRPPVPRDGADPKLNMELEEISQLNSHKISLSYNSEMYDYLVNFLNIKLKFANKENSQRWVKRLK